MKALAEQIGDIDGVNIYGRVVGAVSYTHLRAHETVLDLVCRLLLEKKKNKQAKKAYGIRTWYH